jgi:hypothetical protein
MGWRLLAATGMRRDEALALRWWDVDLDPGRLVVRRSVGVVKAEGAGERLVEGPTRTGRSRVVGLDSGTVAALRAYRAARGLLALDLVRDSALVLDNLDGTPAWAVRRPTASRRCSRADLAREVHAGITRASEAPTARHPAVLTCRNTGVRLCPGGDALHTHTAPDGAEVLLQDGLGPGCPGAGAVLGPGPDLSRCGAREELQLRSRPRDPR